jgi:hypothetical protein
MSRLWIWLWLAVLVGQLSSLWLVNRFVTPVQPILNAEELGLLGLARETVTAWEGIEIPPSEKDRQSPGHSLLAREEWLLRIRDAEEAAQARGIEVRLTDDLQAWLRSSTTGAAESVEGERLIAYLMDLDHWLGMLAAKESKVQAERVFLQPDGGSAYPALQFELVGPPDRMAALLYEHAQRSLDWDVHELDLNRQPGEGTWWMRGSCAFRNRVPE